MTDDKTFTIRFEEDPSPPDVFRTRSLYPKHHSESLTPLEEPNYLVTETEISDSYLSATLSTIQPLTGSKSLLILLITCHPAPERRFEHATLTWCIGPATSPPLTAPSPTDSLEKPLLTPPKRPEIVNIAPHQSVGGWTEEQTRLIWGLKFPAQLSPPGGSVAVVPSIEKERQKVVMHAMAILGSVRGNGTRATWTIQENKSSERGIPSYFQLAVVVDHHGPFTMELNIKASLAGGLWSTYLHAKKDGHQLKRTIDVETWKCGDVVWEPDEAGWRKYVATMTGEVPGIVLDFDQTIARP